MKSVNTKGFSAVEILLGIVIVSVIGGAGYFVYNSQKESDTSLNNAAQANADTSPVKKLETSSDDSTEKKNVPQPEEPVKTTSSHYVNGINIELPKSMGQLLSWSRTAEASNLSSSTLLEKEKELYGDASLTCKANDYPLGAITVKDESTPFPGETLVKKLESGKYLFYADTTEQTFCYKERSNLRDMIKEQVQTLKTALQAVK